METVEVVIRIPKRTYDRVSERGIIAFGDDAYYIGHAIANGTVIPKGHRRLIDADELKKHKYHDNNRFENAVAVAQIDWADTIIEADKEVENADSN